MKFPYSVKYDGKFYAPNETIKENKVTDSGENKKPVKKSVKK